MFSRICHSIPHIPYSTRLPYLQQRIQPRSISYCVIGQEHKFTIKLPEYLKERIYDYSACQKQNLPPPHTTVILAQNSEILLNPLLKRPLISYSIENMLRSNFNNFPVTATSNEKISELALSLGSIVFEYHSEQNLTCQISVSKDIANAFNLHDKLYGASINFLSPHHPFLSSESINSAISYWAVDELFKRDLSRSVSGEYYEKHKLVFPYDIKKLCSNGLNSFTFKQYISPTLQTTSHLKFRADQKEAFTVIDDVSFRIAEEILNPS